MVLIPYGPLTDDPDQEEFAAYMDVLTSMDLGALRRLCEGVLGRNVPPKLTRNRSLAFIYLASRWFSGDHARVRDVVYRACDDLHVGPTSDALPSGPAPMHLILLAVKRAGGDPRALVARLPEEASNALVERATMLHTAYAELSAARVDRLAWSEEAAARKAQARARLLERGYSALAARAERKASVAAQVVSQVATRERTKRDVLKADLTSANARVAELTSENRALLQQLQEREAELRLLRRRLTATHEGMRPHPLDGQVVLVVGDQQRAPGYRETAEGLGAHECLFVSGFAHASELRPRIQRATLIVVVTAAMSHANWNLVQMSAVPTVRVSTAGIGAFRRALSAWASTPWQAGAVPDDANLQPAAYGRGENAG